MRIAMLGPLAVHDDDGAPVDIPGARLRTLLARLALDCGTPVAPDALIDAVWAQSPPAGAANALQSLVTRLRRRLPASATLESEPAGYRLVVPEHGVDVDDFEALIAAGTLRQALALWRGEAFAGLSSPAFEAAAVRLSELRLRAIEDLIDGELDTGSASPRIAELVQLVAAHPLREGLRALHMRALAAAGRPAQALASYEQLRVILATELGTDPSPALRELHLTILRADTAPQTTPRPPARTALTSFVGRTAELAELASVLREARLVSVVGPGGAGKTRLAAELLADTYTDPGEPAWLVELAGVREPVEVAGAVLSTLGITDTGLLHSGPAQPLPRLVDALRDRRALIVLDNCEHQLDACARLAEAVLGSCPWVRIVVTTREPLALTGEVLFPLGPLPIPPVDIALDDASEVASLRLFVDRARAVRPGFTLTAANLNRVAEICRRLDGLPLAIELACARLRTAGVDEIAARLGDRFRLLTGGSRTALPRHQTLAAVVEWSWATFTEAERVLATRLAVFADGTTPDAAEAVCGGDGLTAADVLDVLGSLVDKSFVQLLDVPGAPPRYRMLDTIRAYAAGQLAQAGEAEQMRRRHARYVLGMAETAEPALRGHDQLRWLAWFRREYGNVTTALRWAVDSGDTETAVRLAVATGWYWILCGSTGEAAAWLREVLDLPDLDTLPGEQLAVAYAYDAIQHFSVQDVARATRSAAAAREAADVAHHPAVAIVTAIIQLNAFDLAAAMASLGQLVDHPDPWAAAVGALMRGHAAEAAGEPSDANKHFATSREMFIAVGDRWGIMMALVALANTESLAGDCAAAIATFGEAERCAQEVGIEDDLEWTRARRGYERFRSGDIAGARASLERTRAAGLARSRATLATVSEAWLADLARHEGDLDLARDLLTASLIRLDGANGALIPRLRVLGMLALSRVDVAAGSLPAAAAGAADALTLALSIGDRSVLAEAAQAMAAIAAARADHVEAARQLGLASAARGSTDRGNPDIRATEQAARAALGNAAYDRAYSAAAALSPDAAVTAISATSTRL